MLNRTSSLARLTLMAYSVRLWLKTKRYWVWNPAGLDVCHQGCAHKVSKVSKRFEVRVVLSMVMCTVKNPRSQSIRVGHSSDFGLLSVLILPWCAESDVKQNSITHSITNPPIYSLTHSLSRSLTHTHARAHSSTSYQIALTHALIRSPGTKWLGLCTWWPLVKNRCYLRWHQGARLI